MEGDWFKAWFNTPYYHILYKHRDQEEAAGFLDLLVEHLNIKKEAKILDLACGKGRHSIYLNLKGFDVIGADLSEKNIQVARAFENPKLKFVVHDMRQPIINHRFDYIFNLFTSFGYFESEEEDLKTLHSIYEGLHPGGTFILDFLNARHTLEHLTREECLTIDGMEFNIHRELDKGFILKRITFQDKGETKEYFERVKAITPDVFETYFSEVGFQVSEKFGDYQLNPFQPLRSERLIYQLTRP